MCSLFLFFVYNTFKHPTSNAISIRVFCVNKLLCCLIPPLIYSTPKIADKYLPSSKTMRKSKVGVFESQSHIPSAYDLTRDQKRNRGEREIEHKANKYKMKMYSTTTTKITFFSFFE
jgi:hypothetical protein